MIPVYQPHLGGREKEYVNQCLDSTWISSKGEFISRFESGSYNPSLDFLIRAAASLGKKIEFSLH